MITFDPLWKTMKEKGVSQYALINKYNVSPGQITRLKRNSNVNTNTINTLCNILECEITDVISYTRDQK
ncbi:MAG: helix-turn-helix transcriptional regulator [Erysipelotrichaceae bacterium]|nr:helix-turn-helix transcriptional regulator [Erysipelotrichaceae bacterium]